jgi:hypothetical protein
LSEEYTSTGIAVCVNVSSRKPHSDTTVILQRGDHSFVTHESVINYQDAREMPINLVEQALTARTSQFVCVPHDPCSPELLGRIRDGLVKSKPTPKGIKTKCKALWGIS